MNKPIPHKDSYSFSILDRLLNRNEEVFQIKLAVMRDITNLLNTKINTIIPKELLEVQNSVVSYGLPNFSMIEASVKDISDEIKSSILKALATHEPRLKNIEVEITNIAKYAINFTINATFLTDPDPIQIKFDSKYQPDLQQFNIKEHTDSF
jgi:type VI secretion system protein ImpF